jgi:hypothetical protein
VSVETETTPIESSVRVYKPISPAFLFGMAWVWSPIVSGIGYALNWRGFGKPGWILPTLALVIGFPVLTGVALAFYSTLTPTTMGGTIGALFLAFCMCVMIGANIGLLAGLRNLQGGAYRKWKQGRSEAMLRHVYDLQEALIPAILWTVGIAIVIMGLILALAIPMALEQTAR